MSNIEKSINYGGKDIIMLTRTIWLIIESVTNLKKTLMIFRKHTNLGLSDIKLCIQNKKPLMSVNYVNHQDMEKLKKLVEELLNNSVEIRLYEQYNDNFKVKELPIENFINSFESHRQIEQDTMEAIEDEVDDDIE